MLHIYIIFAYCVPVVQLIIIFSSYFLKVEWKLFIYFMKIIANILLLNILIKGERERGEIDKQKLLFKVLAVGILCY